MATLPVSSFPEQPARELPDYMPARMVNEFVYCPRLFFYEWVEGLFQESVDTVEGAIQHKRVDEKSTALPAAESLPRFLRRSLPRRRASPWFLPCRPCQALLPSRAVGCRTTLPVVPRRSTAKAVVPNDLEGLCDDSPPRRGDEQHRLAVLRVVR